MILQKFFAEDHANRVRNAVRGFMIAEEEGARSQDSILSPRSFLARAFVHA